MGKRKPPVYTLEDEFGFGKHMNDQVEDVIHDDPEYIAWLIEEEVVEFDEGAMALIEKQKIV
jgi:hypothetical protein